MGCSCCKIICSGKKSNTKKSERKAPNVSTEVSVPIGSLRESAKDKPAKVNTNEYGENHMHARDAHEFLPFPLANNRPQSRIEVSGSSLAINELVDLRHVDLMVSEVPVNKEYVDVESSDSVSGIVEKPTRSVELVNRSSGLLEWEHLLLKRFEVSFLKRNFERIMVLIF